MTQKEWNEVDSELRRIAVESYADGYRVKKNAGKEEIDSYRDYYENCFPSSYKKNLSDESIEVILQSIMFKQKGKSAGRVKAYVCCVLGLLLLVGISTLASVFSM